MSEQPRRRRRQIETDAEPIADISETVQKEDFVSERKKPVVYEPEVLRKMSKLSSSMPIQKEQKEKRISISCLGAAVVYVIAYTVDICLNSTFTLYTLCVSLVIGVLAILPLVAAFSFKSKGKHAPATVCAVIMVVSEVIPFVGRIGASSDYVQISKGAWIINILISLLAVVPSVALLVFTVKKKKNYHVWFVIGTGILILHIISVLYMAVIGGSMYGLVSGSAAGLVYFFGMINIRRPKERQECRNGKYVLLEEYKKNRRMMN